MKSSGHLPVDSALRNRYHFKLCLITDFRFIPEPHLEKIISEAISGGVDCIQYRDKDTEYKIQVRRALRIKKITEKTDTPLIINSLPLLVKEVDAEGLHASSALLPRLKEVREGLGRKIIIGVSAHNEQEIRAASAENIDYLIISPIFSPGSKKNTPPLGEKEFSKLRTLTHLPVVALGGITQNNTHIPIHLGATGIACITGLLHAQDIKKTARALREKISVAETHS